MPPNDRSGYARPCLQAARQEKNRRYQRRYLPPPVNLASNVDYRPENVVAGFYYVRSDLCIESPLMQADDVDGHLAVTSGNSIACNACSVDGSLHALQARGQYRTDGHGYLRWIIRSATHVPCPHPRREMPKMAAIPNLIGQKSKKP